MRERDGKGTSIVSVVNPRNDLGETSGKEKRARGREREKESGLDENVERRRKGKIESREKRRGQGGRLN